MGCLNLLCNTECTECDYYKVVAGQGINILIVSENKKLVNDLNTTDDLNGFHVKFAENEYETAVTIQSFRPDYIVVDCTLGKYRTTAICDSLFSDIRIPIVRIVLCSKTRKPKGFCDNDVFGWIRKPFFVEQLKECIRGVPKTTSENVS